jgi:hypothetical protein
MPEFRAATDADTMDAVADLEAFDGIVLTNGQKHNQL